jgi:predicted HTH domain antitoxin
LTGFELSVKYICMSKQVTVEVAESAVRLFGPDERRFGREMYETAVVKWYDEGRISSGKGSELLGISRAEFLDLLFRHQVSPFQYTPEELAEDLKGV